MAKKVLVVYFSQTGQLKEIVNSITKPMAEDNDVLLSFEELRPKPPFPFPYTSDEFFQVMPESVKGIPCELEPFIINEKEHFDLIILAWQPWYLSPSIPVHAFFQHSTSKKILYGKPVVTVIGCRNMWVVAHEKVRQYIQQAGGRLVGNILLYDKAPNLLSVLSVIRWLFYGRKDRYMKIIPPAGVSQEDIAGASQYGQVIREALQKDDLENLRTKLVNTGAVDVQTGLIMMEKRAIIFFRFWADFILKKGPYGAKSRVGRLRLFKYYLLAMIYLISPFATILYQIIKPFRRKTLKKQISLYQS